jgi:pimeloyl-ACP methyl ester carboxylesterase
MPERVVVGGHRVEYELSPAHDGGGATLVFLHEGLGCISTWRDFPNEVAAATGLPALVYSRWGYGGSDPVTLPRPLTYMHDEAKVLPELLDALRIREAVLVGHSDGASIAIIHAGSDPGPRLSGLVLFAPHVFVEDISIASIAAAKEAYETGDLRARLARHHGSNADGAFRGWNDAWLDPQFRSWNIEEYLPRIHVPSLVVQGEDDEYGTLAQVDAIAEKAGAPVTRCILAGARHAPYKDRPAAALAAVTDFLAAIGCRAYTSR